MQSRIWPVVLALVLCAGIGGRSAYGAKEEAQPVAQTGVSGEIESKDSTKVSKGEPLEAPELAQLEKRTEEPGAEVTGGALSNLHLTYIVIALAAAVLVLILK